MSSDQPTLLEGLLGDAFEHFGRAIPTVVAAKSVDEAAGGAAASYEMPFSWPKCVVGASAELGSAVSEQLSVGPVLLVPPWGRRADRRDQLSRNEHEVAILNCAPGGPDSLLAVLTPASTWISQQAQPVRELAKRWRPALVIYAAGVLPGIHPSVLLAAVFLRPPEAQESLLRISGYRQARTTLRSPRTSGACSSDAAAAGISATSCAICPRPATAWRLIATIPRWPPREQNCPS